MTSRNIHYAKITSSSPRDPTGLRPRRPQFEDPDRRRQLPLRNQRILKASGSSATLKKLERFAFFDAGKDHHVALTIATAEQRLYANLLLQIGVVFPESGR
jgi:L-fucose mutarotase/ribose pyranase (RbsD/FucU family)